jgi:hypothetical protein
MDARLALRTLEEQVRAHAAEQMRCAVRQNMNARRASGDRGGSRVARGADCGRCPCRCSDPGSASRTLPDLGSW